MDSSAWLLIIAVVAMIAAPFVTLSAVSTWRTRRKSGKPSAPAAKDQDQDKEDSSSGYW